jgi:cytoskeletal protein CcmA (bactofilin family)
MADSSANIPQRPGWNAPNVGTAVEHATIGSSIVIKGEVSGNEALFVDGTVEGTISIPGYRVTVGRNSTVKADITARDVVVMGTVQGNIHCADLLDIRAESYLQGQVVTNRIRIDDGAVLRGSVEIQRAEKSKVVAASPVTAAPKKVEEAVVPAVKSETPAPAPESKPAESEGAKALAAAVARRMAGTGGWFKSGR